MSTIISASDFQAIALYYGNVRTILGNITGYLYNAVTRVALIDDVEPSVDLITDFYNSYTVNSVTLTSPTPLLAAVRKLNSHILNRGGYSDIDQYLDAHSITVPNSWAALSALAGQTIDPSNIVG